ncbi:riboflavin synthase [Sinomicrobium soli]|uniref:riboflavin synthase n=1 Tax=Sinomicrobium sp. N-1-3-6 TaxID=2219864 RepID=UPI000DCD86D0|nr:riboflavin synthase [Sinomicrobium sp. N-1-3-6]RAV28327.1 riboflavin synthase [Sinomicrobium sp. N-1-3-6]
MFTGIIETLGTIENIAREEDNLHITVRCSFTGELQIDQSVSHNGVCLTVVGIDEDRYTVTAIRETLQRSNLGQLKPGDMVNLERAMKLGERLDGHIVQGHVDQTAVCRDIEHANGSRVFTFGYDASSNNVTIEKGSITIDGTSLTVVDSGRDFFSVAIIPYTFDHTNFRNYTKGTVVNLEFDVVGKYVSRLMELRS